MSRRDHNRWRVEQSDELPAGPSTTGEAGGATAGACAGAAAAAPPSPPTLLLRERASFRCFLRGFGAIGRDQNRTRNPIVRLCTNTTSIERRAQAA